MSEWLILHSSFVNPLVLLISGFCIIGCVCRAGLLDKDVYELRWRLTYVFALIFAGWSGFDTYRGIPTTEKELAALFALLFHLVVSQSKWRNGEPPIYMRKDFVLNKENRMSRLKLLLGGLVWGFYAPFMIAVVLFTYFIAPVLALGCFVRNTDIAHESSPRENRERLVSWLYWFQTFDNPLDEAYWGNYGLNDWVARFRANYANNALSRYMWRVYWLWRNPSYGFARWPFGAKCAAWEMAYEKDGNWLAVSTDGGWFTPFTLRTTNWYGWNFYIGWKVTRTERDGLPRKMYTIQFKRAKRVKT